MRMGGCVPEKPVITASPSVRIPGAGAVCAKPSLGPTAMKIATATAVTRILRVDPSRIGASFAAKRSALRIPPPRRFIVAPPQFDPERNEVRLAR
jgi:hypothetical protein